MPARQDSLTRAMAVQMCTLAKEDPLGFKACTRNSVAIGTFSGFCQQEYDMDSKTDIKYYIRPDSTCIVRAFTVHGTKLHLITITAAAAWSKPLWPTEKSQNAGPTI